jgi:hypothetical protein
MAQVEIRTRKGGLLERFDADLDPRDEGACVDLLRRRARELRHRPEGLELRAREGRHRATIRV